MADFFNPYQQWLELPGAGPPTLYELFSLRPFENDTERIAQAADRALARVRKHRPGDNAKAWSGLLDELTQAKKTLLDTTKRSAYDESLRQVAAVNRPASAVSESDGSRKDDPRFPPGGKRSANPAVKAPPVDSAATVTAPATARQRPSLDKLAPAKGANPVITALPPTSAKPTAAVDDAADQLPDSWLPPGAEMPGQAMDSIQPPAPSGAPSHYQSGYPTAVPNYPPAGYADPHASAPAFGSYAQPGQPYPAAQSGYGHPQPSGYVNLGYGHPAAHFAQPTYGQNGYSPPGYGQPMQPQYAGQPTSYPPAGYANAQAPQAAWNSYGQPAPVGHGGYEPTASTATAFGPTGQAAVPVAVFGGAAAPLSPNSPSAAISLGVPAADTAFGMANDGPSRSPSNMAGVAIAQAARRNEKNRQLLLVIGGVSVAMLLLLSAVAYTFFGRETSVAQAPLQQPVPRATTPNPATNGAPATGVTPPAAASNSAPPMSTGTPNATTQAPKAVVPSAEPSPKPTEVIDKPSTEVMATDPEMAADPSMADPAMSADPEMAAPKPPATDVPDEAMSPEPPTTIPDPEAMPDDAPNGKATLADLQALGAALTSAREALAEQKYEEVDTQLAVATQHARSKEQAAMIERLSTIKGLAKQFTDAVSAAMAELEVGETFKVGSSTTVVVVEASADKLAVRVGASTKTYRVQDLPQGVAAALADMKLEPADPTNRVIKGAFLASGKNSDASARDKAKTFWEEAQLNGVDVQFLMPFFTDKYDFKKEAAALEKAG